MNIELFEILAIALVGLVAGLLGGLLGIGGAIIMIPGLVILLRDSDPRSQHLYQAAVMAVNVAVAIPSAIRHHQAGAVRWDLFRIVLPVASVAIIAGVLASDQLDPMLLRRTFAAFLVYVAVVEIRRGFRKAPDRDPAESKVTFWRGSVVGVVMGFLAGLLGIGGGILAVPLLYTLCRLPLRHAIGVSAATMVLTATAGAILKISTLPLHEQDPLRAIFLAANLSVTAMLGGWIGASLTHRLPIHIVRAVLVVIVILAAWRLSGL